MHSPPQEMPYRIHTGEVAEVPEPPPRCEHPAHTVGVVMEQDPLCDEELGKEDDDTRERCSQKQARECERVR